MNVPLDQVCEYVREWGDLPVQELRSMLAEKLGDEPSAYKGRKRGELLAMLLADYPDWGDKTPVCTR